MLQSSAGAGPKRHLAHKIAKSGPHLLSFDHLGQVKQIFTVTKFRNNCKYTVEDNETLS
jgi:hypothetical protein